MLYWGWLLFLFNEFFNLIVLLNFLIAIISQSYEEVMGREVINRYQSRCAIILEIAQLIDAIKYNRGNRSEANRTMLHLIAKASLEKGQNEFQGFVKSIKQALKRENKKLREDLTKLIPTQEQMLKIKSEMKEEMKDMKTSLESQMVNLSDKLDSQLAEIMRQLKE